jgi:hypothetical protein
VSRSSGVEKRALLRATAMLDHSVDLSLWFKAIRGFKNARGHLDY